MSDWVKFLAKWLCIIVTALVGWLFASPDLRDAVKTSIVGTRS